MVKYFLEITRLHAPSTDNAAYAPSVCPASSFGQQSILNTNLIVNPGADAGPAGTSLSASVSSIPGWTIASGAPTVLPYGLALTSAAAVPGGLLVSSDPAPPDHSFQYFVGSPRAASSSLTQTIDVSSGASTISGGNVKFTLSAYLGSIFGSGQSAQMSAAFQNANGQTFTTIPLNGFVRPISPSLFLQQQIGLVPPGTVRITVTLSLPAINVDVAAADSLSLVLSPLGTDPATVLGPNLISNPGAEGGPGVPAPGYSSYLPGWSNYYGLAAPYGGTGWIQAADPGPADRGANVFWGIGPGYEPCQMYQDIDVSAAATLVDAGKVTYAISGWLGALNSSTTPTLTYTFFDWTGKQLSATAQLGPATHNGNSLVLTSSSGVLPAGTRRVNINVTFPSRTSLADNLSFTLSPAGAPTVLPGGIVPVFSSATTIQPGSWASIYGTNFATGVSVWNGNFPTTLGNVNVTVNSRPAYLWLVSPTQINFQAPDDTATGSVNVVVTNPNGSATSTVTLGQYGPSFSLFNGNKYAAAIVQLPVGTIGNSGSNFDYIGPSGSQSFPTRPVKAGEIVQFYGVGFGPTTPPVAAGGAFTGVAPAAAHPTVTIGGVPATVPFAGIVEGGLFQINVVVPSAGSGDKLVSATAGGLQTPNNVYLTLQ
jgi:uncharacterized protein (TIGR03437 family)